MNSNIILCNIDLYNKLLNIWKKAQVTLRLFSEISPGFFLKKNQKNSSKSSLPLLILMIATDLIGSFVSLNV